MTLRGRSPNASGEGASQRLLWVTLQKVGDAKLAGKDLTGALAASEEGLSLAKARAADEPTNPEAARDLSISLPRSPRCNGHNRITRRR